MGVKIFARQQDSRVYPQWVMLGLSSRSQHSSAFPTYPAPEPRAPPKTYSQVNFIIT
jgi:hypothetical protein